MAYNRGWFAEDKFAWTVGGGFVHNPSRYLVLLPTDVAGQQFDMSAGRQCDGWDGTTSFDWMPDNFQTWPLEFSHREAIVPYFAGTGGVTGLTGYTTSPPPANWTSDLFKQDARGIGALLLRFRVHAPGCRGQIPLDRWCTLGRIAAAARTHENAIAPSRNQ